MKCHFLLIITFARIVSLTFINAEEQKVSCQNGVAQSNFFSNRDAVLASLVSNATIPSGSHNATSLSTTANSTAYGVFFCRGDTISSQCLDCVFRGSNFIRQSCPTSPAADMWFDNCTLRYSNQPIVSKLSLTPNHNITNRQGIPDQIRFNEVLRKGLLELKDEIVKGTAGVGYGKRLFGTKTTAFSPLQTIRSLAQCSPDLSARDCDLCLNASIAQLPICCSGTQGARVLMPSCIIRYEIFTFYDDPPFEPDVHALDPIAGSGGGGRSSRVIVAIVVPLVVVTAVAAFVAWYCFWFRWQKKANTGDGQNGDHEIDASLLRFGFDAIQAATEDFSPENKIGEGGFGEVFQGRLSNGTHIAVKRLSECSKQGAHEFKNEVLLVAKLQHRNLVQLLGFCLEGPERILIYDFIPNKSLDQILFDPMKEILLDWPQRYRIINGIARGMLYLHEDSPLKIIHRDLKASNILLDENLNPKISDFGTARIVGNDESQIKTKRIVGTLIREAHFSEKSDVYSFGVLVMEIISAKKNVSCDTDEDTDLLSFVWKTWMNGSPLALLDPCLGDQFPINEVLKCIHMALLCVQENVSHRPTMQTIVLMLNNSSVSMPRPQKPTYIP